MDRMIEELRRIGQNESPPTEARADARARMEEAVVAPANRRRHRLMTPGRAVAAVAVAAAVTFGVLVVPPPDVGNTPGQAASPSLSMLFMQAASASEQQATSDGAYWYSRVSFADKMATDGNTSGVNESWIGRDGSFKLGDVREPKFSAAETPNVPTELREKFRAEAVKRWNDARSLPSDSQGLRSALELRAKAMNVSADGTVLPVPADRLPELMTGEALSLLMESPISAETRSALFRFLDEKAAAGVLHDRGNVTDSQGRDGHALAHLTKANPASSEIGSFEVVYIFDPATGAFLEHRLIQNGVVNLRFTNEAVGFVESDTTRL